jgi:poly(ribitol-phosphate) beta-N-acetylglucosaminyltransferase
MYKISVIMPIYNAGKYLKNALDSVINQSIGFENIELILVDDKSTDNSKCIIEEYSNAYSNIVPIFLEENTGWSGIPRNIGIKNATADYIMFIDNDDEYFPEICDKLYNTLILENADIVVCDSLHTDNSGTNLFQVDSDMMVYGKEIVYFDNVLVWRCIFKKSIIWDNNINFINMVNEDGVFTVEYYMHSEKLVYLNDFIGYNHIERSSSLSCISFDFSIKVLKSYYMIIKLLKESGVKYDLNRFFTNKIQVVILFVIMLDNKDEIKELLSTLHDFEKSINFVGNLPIIHNCINFFILHGNLNIATYICLFFSKVKKSNLLLNVYMKFLKD